MSLQKKCITCSDLREGNSRHLGTNWMPLFGCPVPTKLLSHSLLLNCNLQYICQDLKQAC